MLANEKTMAKIPGAAILFIGLVVFVVTAYAQFEKSAKILFTVVAALLIVYGAGSMSIDIINRNKKNKETKSKFNQTTQAQQQYAAQNVHGAHAKQQAFAQPRVPQGAIGFCSVCGAVARADDNFCGKCGSRLR